MLHILGVAAIFHGEKKLKDYIELHKQESQNEPALKGAILVTKYHNYGAFLEKGKKHGTLVRACSVGLTVGVGIFFMLTLFQKGNGLLKAGLTLLLGGAFSNTYDRLKRGYVVDYFRFNVKWQPLRNIIFNISDFCILIGALMSALDFD